MVLSAWQRRAGKEFRRADGMNKTPNLDSINTPEEAFERMQQELQAGNSDKAIVIADRLIRLARENLLSIREPLVDAVSHGLENGRLHQRIWEIDKAAGYHNAYFPNPGRTSSSKKISSMEKRMACSSISAAMTASTEATPCFSKNSVIGRESA